MTFISGNLRPIPFEDVLTVLVSTFHLLSVCYAREGRKGGGRLLIKTESVYSLKYYENGTVISHLEALS